ncbi:MAG: PQQ-binding-like beta-propeller repeat protein, partial [Phycisphaerales bacterium]|nr:PQQ-binding-like beta-propeller repeat protein [Phycisphaerales bacterium]
MRTWFRRLKVGVSFRNRSVLACATVILLMAAGCSSSVRTNPADEPARATVSTIDPAKPVIDRDDLAKLGYRLEWQSIVGAGRLNGVKMVELIDDALFIVDNRNTLSRLRAADASVFWSSPVGTPVEELQGMIYVPDVERVYVVAGGQTYVIDSVNGVPTARQQLDKIASTEPVLFGDSMIYGSRDGKVIWYGYRDAFQRNAYQVAQSIHVTPTLHNGILATVGVRGEVMLINAASASQLWSKKLLDPVVAPAAMDDRAVYVACRDQHLYAFDLGSGRQLWRRLFEQPLVDAPVVIGDDLYQQVPGHGLMCFEAVPFNEPNGVLRWNAADVTGHVIATRGDRLTVWDPSSGTLTSVDQRTGAVRHEVTLDN